MNPKAKKIIIACALILLPLSAYTTMVVVAYSSHSGTEEHRAYERSKRYDAEKSERKRFDELGYAFQCKPQSTANERAVALSIDKQPGILDHAVLEFKRPSDAHADFSLHWADVHNTKVCAVPLKGRWYIELVAQRGAETIRTRREVFVP